MHIFMSLITAVTERKMIGPEVGAHLNDTPSYDGKRHCSVLLEVQTDDK